MQRHRSRPGELPSARIGMVSWVVTSVLMVLVVLHPSAASATHPLQLHGALQRDELIGIVSHRGAAALAPENTLAAFRLAIEQGVDFVETDVQLTADGVAVLMHDPDLERTTNGSGPLAAHTYEQVAALDAGGWFAPEFAGERVPTLEAFVDMLDAAPTRAFLELKGEWPTEQLSEVIELLRANHLVHRIVIASFERPVLEAVRELAPEYATILLTRDLSPETVGYAIDLQVSAVCARQRLLAEHPEARARFAAAGIGAIVYTLNSTEEWRQAVTQELDFVVTDDPVALAAWRFEETTKN